MGALWLPAPPAGAQGLGLQLQVSVEMDAGKLGLVSLCVCLSTVGFTSTPSLSQGSKHRPGQGESLFMPYFLVSS